MEKPGLGSNVRVSSGQVSLTGHFLMMLGGFALCLCLRNAPDHVTGND